MNPMKRNFTTLSRPSASLLRLRPDTLALRHQQGILAPVTSCSALRSATSPLFNEERVQKRFYAAETPQENEKKQPENEKKDTSVEVSGGESEGGEGRRRRSRRRDLARMRDQDEDEDEFFADPFSSALSPWSRLSASPFTMMDRMLRDPFAGFFDRDVFDPMAELGRTTHWTPRVDVSESDNELTVHAELPGVKKDDIKVELKNDFLTITGEKRFSQKKEEGDEKKGQQYRRIEQSYGYFSRRFALPEGCDPSQVKAKFENGVLEVSIPKPKEEEVAKRHTIEIQ
ncbi:Heat shock protein Hsp20 [Balamuthia mandrillaris]